MVIIGFFAIIAMIVGGGYAFFKAEERRNKLYGLAFLCIGLYLLYLFCTSPSSSDDDEEPLPTREYNNEYKGYGPDFNGGYKGKSCNISSHGCIGGFDEDRDGNCDVCEANGFDCHMVYHH